MKSTIRLFMLFVLLATAANGLAQDARTLMNNTAKALGADSLKRLHYSGTGSSYIVTDDPAPASGWQHTVMKSFVCDLNVEAATAHLQLVRIEGAPPVNRTMDQVIDADSPWSSQYQFWITPYGFLKGARTYEATVESKTVFGTPYRVLTFTLPGNHKVVGYINDKNLIDKVETWIGGKNDILVEAQYRDYTDFGGVKVPTTVVHKQAGELSLILIVADVKAG